MVFSRQAGSDYRDERTPRRIRALRATLMFVLAAWLGFGELMALSSAGDEPLPAAAAPAEMPQPIADAVVVPARGG